MNQSTPRSCNGPGFAALAITLALIGCGNAERSVEAPQQVAEAGYAAIGKLDWKTYATLLDFEALRQFQESVQPALEPLAPMDSTGNRPEWLTLFGDSMATADLIDAPPDQFFVSVMERTFSVSAELAKTFQGMQNSVVGGVYESDDDVYLVIKTEMDIGPNHIREMNVLSLKRSGGEWKLLLSNKISGIGELVRSTIMGRA
ncbi:MAG: hypothetical protein ACE5FH_10140 [Candidatus Zixiibacteriota bacterium]